MSDWINISPQDEFEKGQSRLVEIDDTAVAVFNLEGEYFAMEDVCTHDGSALLGCGLEPEDLIEGDELICPRHGARFSIRTGEALTSPAYEPVCTFAVRIEKGMVQVRDHRDD
ncbi:MAG: non-heme iron oxygenase ferredoxin subunit [Gammaproteobacteria bacterium]|jgi:3-phenylpropionate/trans-cinnamate dioxygenase ferredoxin subunit